MIRLALFAFLPLLLLGVGCAPATELTAEEKCELARERVAECFPGVSFEAECNEETLQKFEEYGLEGEGCDGIKKVGKADWFSFGGCGQGEHECGLIFCCDDYLVTWYPVESDWDIIPVVQVLHNSIPADVRETLEQATREELLDGLSGTYQQDVAEKLGGAIQEMAVEVSLGLAEIPYEDYLTVLPAEDWGIELAHYLGGEVIVYETDDQNRAVRQLERMSLSPFPCDVDVPLTNMDMTKVEVIVYEPDRAIVYWRVMYSNNDSTETDVGSVEFKKYDEGSTLVTFHSAHRLNMPGGLHIPNDVVELVLKTFFIEHIQHYADLVEIRL